MDSLGALQRFARGDRWPTAVASLAVGGAFFSFVVLGCFRSGSGSRWKWRAQHVGDGWPRFRRCWDSRLPCAGVWGLSGDGRRHTCPVAPPQRLVLVGFYRYVRNPMYWARSGVDRVVGCVRNAKPAAIAALDGGCPRRAYCSCFLYEEPNSAQEIRGRPTKSIAGTWIDVAACARLGLGAVSHDPQIACEVVIAECGRS